jgi:HEPN domain-containing protein
MPRKPVAPGSPEEWLVRAKSNLALAGQPKPEGALWEDQCFQAHQAAEKALKAVYQYRGLMFQFVHDLKKLCIGLEQGGLRLPPEIREAIVLTKYAFETRYPGPFDPVTEKEHKKALSLAEAVVAWADKIINLPGAHEPRAIYRPPEAASRRRRLPAQIYKKNLCRVDKPKKKKRK